MTVCRDALVICPTLVTSLSHLPPLQDSRVIVVRRCLSSSWFALTRLYSLPNRETMTSMWTVTLLCMLRLAAAAPAADADGCRGDVSSQECFAESPASSNALLQVMKSTGRTTPVVESDDDDDGGDITVKLSSEKDAHSVSYRQEHAGSDSASPQGRAAPEKRSSSVEEVP
eukprot:TRINITY_DN34082_c0_g2_i1.p1 TRINITY_DN34082_c0_g2~~TRINITY_DN34082_c0_g2_i1.p1  ORF type:complete len:171 (+),score=26.60 TRINITY_DN34082_c0_g2_i1:426-938(+)